MKSLKSLKIRKIQTVFFFDFQGLTFFSIFDLKTWWFMLMMQTPWHFQIFAKGSFFCTQSTLCFHWKSPGFNDFLSSFAGHAIPVWICCNFWSLSLHRSGVFWNVNMVTFPYENLWTKHWEREKQHPTMRISVARSLPICFSLCFVFYRYVHFIRARLWRLGRCLSHQLHCWLPVSPHWFSEGMVITSPEVRVLCTHESQDSRYVGISLIIPR